MAPSTKPGWVDWCNQVAGEIMQDDLSTGILPLTEEEMPAAEAFAIYSQEDDFKDICFDQFKERLASYRKSYGKKKQVAAMDEYYMQQDRLKHPRKMYNRRHEKVFDLDDAAKKQLRQDVQEGKHLTMTPSQLRMTQSFYQEYKLVIFKRRVYQMVRRFKFENYLEEKRKEKKLRALERHDEMLTSNPHWYEDYGRHTDRRMEHWSEDAQITNKKPKASES